MLEYAGPSQLTLSITLRTVPALLKLAVFIMSIAPDTLSSIGNTLPSNLPTLIPANADYSVRWNTINPGGSIKDRIALSMINRAEQQGVIHPGDHLFEATAGNTGMGLLWSPNKKAIV